VDQGTVKKRWGVKFYALAVTVFVHSAALTIFACVKLSQTAPVGLQTTATVSISQASVLAARPSVVPKPKVITEGKYKRIVKTISQGQSANIHPAFDAPKEDSQPPIPAIEGPQIHSGGSVEENRITTAQVEFFDSPAQGRRICYVVDCSGSMQGLWEPVKKELYESIGQLQPDQYFCVIVFGAGNILESGAGLLVRATEKAQKEAYDFIGAVQPRGATNAAAALEQAIKIHDQSGEGPSVIYFLTDGFELSEKDNFRFAHQVATMLKSFAPKTQVNTIGFWTDDRDRKLLEMIARQSGGQFTFVGQKGQKQ
jgi:hypothetical protein